MDDRICGQFDGLSSLLEIPDLHCKALVGQSICIPVTNHVPCRSQQKQMLCQGLGLFTFKVSTCAADGHRIGMTVNFCCHSTSFSKYALLAHGMRMSML